MKIEFNVHGVSKTTTGADVEINGEKIVATIPCYEVELTTTDPRHGSLTLRFVGGAVAEAMETFPNDSIVVWDTSQSMPAPARAPRQPAAAQA